MIFRQLLLLLILLLLDQILLGLCKVQLDHHTAKVLIQRQSTPKTLITWLNFLVSRDSAIDSQFC